MKTRQEIIDEWEEYRNSKIDFDKDWTEEHDNYLNVKFYTQEEVNQLKEALRIKTAVFP